MTRLDYEAIGRVLAAVANDGALPPAGSDAREWRHDLSQDISFAYTLFHTFPDLTSDSRAKLRHAALRTAEQRITKLLDVIEDDKLPLSDAISRHMPKGVFVADALEAMRQVRDASRLERARLRVSGFDSKAPLADDMGNAPSTQGGEFIQRMAKAFKCAFEADARIEYLDREPVGPFLAFVSAAMREAQKISGKPMPIADTPQAIAQAFKRAGGAPLDKDR